MMILLCGSRVGFGEVVIKVNLVYFCGQSMFTKVTIGVKGKGCLMSERFALLGRIPCFGQVMNF